MDWEEYEEFKQTIQALQPAKYEEALKRWLERRENVTTENV